MTPAIADPVIAATATMPTSLITVLTIAVTTLAGVIVYLWRYYDRKLEALAQEHKAEREIHAKEREGWAAERARADSIRMELRAEYEAKHREVMKTVYDDARAREDMIRREYAANMESVSDKANESSEKVAVVLDKLKDHIGGRRHTY